MPKKQANHQIQHAPRKTQIPNEKKDKVRRKLAKLQVYVLQNDPSLRTSIISQFNEIDCLIYSL